MYEVHALQARFIHRLVTRIQFSRAQLSPMKSNSELIAAVGILSDKKAFHARNPAFPRHIPCFYKYSHESKSQIPFPPLYTMRAVAKMLGVSTPTLRIYERRGLLLTQMRKAHQRVYSQSDVERLKCIRMAINWNKISIEGIRRIQSMVPCWAQETFFAWAYKEGSRGQYRS